jgi:hypothetical protein
MNETVSRYANRCLPLLAGNEFGWCLLNERRCTVEWSGDDDLAGLRVHYESAPPAGRAESNFGYGVVTFRVPYLFRTPPGWDLLVRGPTNSPKDGVVALDAVVETDWSPATFTMNWKLTRPGTIVFEAGEPICMLVPQRRHDLESFDGEVRAIASDEQVASEWEAFEHNRTELKRRKFLAEALGDFGDIHEAWEGDYFRGRTAHGRSAPEHLTKRRLGSFGDWPMPNQD